MVLNLHAAWIGFFLGCLAGATPGLFFYRDDWLGGYDSWPRRMIRLAHISFFGIGFLNISFGLTAKTLGLETGLQPASGMLIVGAVTMPIVCYLSAWKPMWRHAFFVPALSVILGVGLFLWRIIVQ